tara:strand:+ start:2174 stop:3286 length:1113 start_codon:yes stop_codon:yes gene_type:complete
MKNRDLYGFDEFNSNNMIKLDEMASSLTKLGVKRDHMQFIHKLSGKLTARVEKTPYRGSGFKTTKSPYASASGPYPTTEDIPLAHDVQVEGVKKGKKQIYHYLTNVVSSKEDTNVRFILVNPDNDGVFYLTKKLGKLTGPEKREMGIDHKSRAELSRDHNVSQKRGLYMRAVSIDLSSGEYVAHWYGRIGEMREDMSENSLLYILKKEDDVRTKRKARTQRSGVTEKDFIDYFVKNYVKILDTQGKSNADALHAEVIKRNALPSSNDRYERDKFNRETNRMEDEANSIKKIDPQKLVYKLNNFLHLAMKEGEYAPDMDDRNRADLTDMVNKDSQPVVASMFLQYLALGRVEKKFYTDNPFVDLGIEDLLF